MYAFSGFLYTFEFNIVWLRVIAKTTGGCLLAGSGLGKKGEPAENVGETAAKMLLNNLWSGGCLDEYLQDQVWLGF
jgi:RNA 3'-terminal phosphate cyclase (ATP)